MSKKTIMVSSSDSGPLSVYKCKPTAGGCGHTFVASADDSYCPFCDMPIKSEGTPLTAEMKASAESDDTKVELVCAGCNRHIFVGSTEESAQALCVSLYCPFCGSAEIDPLEEVKAAECCAGKGCGYGGGGNAIDEKGNIVTLGGEDGDDTAFEDTDTEGGLLTDPPLDQSALAGGKSACQGGEDGIDPAAIEQNTAETEDDVKDALDEEALASLQMVSMSAGADSVILACNKNAEPLFMLRKSKVHASAQPIFGTESFYSVFQDRAQTVGLFAAVNEFNGEIFKAAKFATKTDMQAMAQNFMQKYEMPKFMDCLATALEGSVKGLFPEAVNQLKASFYDELKARTNAPDDTVIQAIEAAVSTGGLPFFTAVVAKTVELMKKPEAGYSEVKAMVQASKVMTTAAVSNDQTEEQAKFKARLEAGNMPISITDPMTALKSRTQARTSFTAAVSGSTVEHMRQNLKLIRK